MKNADAPFPINPSTTPSQKPPKLREKLRENSVNAGSKDLPDSSTDDESENEIKVSKVSSLFFTHVIAFDFNNSHKK